MSGGSARSRERKRSNRSSILAGSTAVNAQRVAPHARDQVHVVVEDGLAGSRAVELDDAQTIRRQDFANRVGDAEGLAHDGAQVLLFGLEDVDGVTPGNYEGVSVRDRKLVHEDEGALVLAHPMGRRPTGFDLAKDAVRHRFPSSRFAGLQPVLPIVTGV